MTVESRGYAAARLRDKLGVVPPYLSTTVMDQTGALQGTLDDTTAKVAFIISLLSEPNNAVYLPLCGTTNFGGLADAVTESVDLGTLASTPTSYIYREAVSWTPTAWTNLLTAVSELQDTVDSIQNQVSYIYGLFLFEDLTVDTWDTTDCDFGNLADTPPTLTCDLGSLASANTTYIPRSYLSEA